MRLPLLLAALALLAGCSSRSEVITKPQKKIPAGARLAVVPFGDALRYRIPVRGTGALMTKAVADNLTSRGFVVTVLEPGAQPAGDYLVEGSFIEWEPDLAMSLEVVKAGSLDAVSLAHSALATYDLKGTRAAAVPMVADDAVAMAFSSGWPYKDAPPVRRQPAATGSGAGAASATSRP